MLHKRPLPILMSFLLIFTVFLSGCSQTIQAVTSNENNPSPLVNEESVPAPLTTEVIVPAPLTTDSAETVDKPDILVDLDTFLPALVQALNTRDTEKLAQWMTDPFLTSTWRFNQAVVSSKDALDLLYAEQLGTEPKLELVESADIIAMLGGVDPLSIPVNESGITPTYLVMYAYLVSGWGKDASDAAILFITLEPGDELKWHGWLQVKRGLSDEWLGGVQAYTNDALGFSLYAPKDYEVVDASPSEVIFLAPGQGHAGDDRPAVFIMVEPLDGRTAEQVATFIAEDNKAVLGSDYDGANITAMEIDGEAAFSVDRLTGQDLNRRVYVAHGDRLYWMMFVPDNPQAAAYMEMEELYALILNTFHFIP